MDNIEFLPYLTFSGNTRETMEYYQRVFGGKLIAQTFAEYGLPTSEAYKDHIMHARLEADDLILMASDPQEGAAPRAGENISLSLAGPAAAKAKLTKYFEALAKDGKITLPLAPSPWGATFGMLNDKFGVQWMVNIDKN